MRSACRRSSVTDSYVQFFKNMNGMGVIILLLVFSGMVSMKKRKAPRLDTDEEPFAAGFLLAKYAGAAVLWTAVYAVGALACQAYALWLFPENPRVTFF